MELWDLYDKDRVKTGRTMVRGSEFEDDYYHLVPHICIFNSDNQMLIQQRQPFKQGWSGYWDVSAAGSAVAGDTSQTAAEREVFEEIGYKADFSNLRPMFTIHSKHAFQDFYVIVDDEIDISKLKLQYEEVAQVKWATLDEIYAMIENGEFIPYYNEFIGFIFAIGSSNGVFKQPF